jgi:hypothetical protein
VHHRLRLLRSAVGRRTRPAREGAEPGSELTVVLVGTGHADVDAGAT